MKKIILFELNEVPYRILDNYIQNRPDSYMARFMSKCRQYETFTEDSIQLDPWISWPTLHRGVPDSEHGILHLGQPAEREVEERYPPIWKRVKAAGGKVGVFGSLGTSIVPDDMEDYSFYLPDYFAGDAVAFPESLVHFQRFNLTLTRESARNVKRSIPLKGSASFLNSLVFGGLKPDTVYEVGSHLVHEMIDKRKRIRRRVMQPLIMCDLFVHQLRETRPDFATFYTNHVAAAMHRYWAALLPGDYQAREIDPEWVASYQEEIPFALEKLEIMLQKLVRFTEENPEYSLLVASSLGQAAIPFQKSFEFLTITNVRKFMSMIGITPDRYDVAPAMVPCVSLNVENIPSQQLIEALQKVRIGEDLAFVPSKKIDRSACFDIRNGHLHLYLQLDRYSGPHCLTADGETYSFNDGGVGMMAHEDGVNCTAQHVPNGSLMIYSPGSADRSRTQISTLDVMPSMMMNYDIRGGAQLPGDSSIVF